MTKRVVLAYSGGLDTSWCIPWLKEKTGAEVITVTVDVGGFDADEREALAKRSAELGAERHVHLDAREAFFDEVLRYLVMGNVLRGHLYPLCVGAERGLQAREVARVARDLGAEAVAHGCTAAGNDQVRFEVALRVEAPELEIMAPIRDEAPTRAQEAEFLTARGFDVPSETKTYSVNTGLWGITIGGRETTGTSETLPEDAWVRTKGAFENPLAPRQVKIGFSRGTPISLDGTALDPVALIEQLDGIAAGYGIGRGIHLGDTILGAKGRVAFEAPAATVLVQAHRELEKATLTAAQARIKDQLAATYGELVHEGQHCQPVARDIEALFLSTQKTVTGEVTLMLRPGSAFVEGVTSEFSLHAAASSVYGEEAHDWTPADAAGFSRLLALPAVLHRRATTIETEDAS